jgi:hypothetical protein
MPYRINHQQEDELLFHFKMTHYPRSLEKFCKTLAVLCMAIRDPNER